MSTDPLDLKNCLCANTRKTDRALSRVYDQALRPTGLTASQFAVLSVLSEVAPLRISDLAQVMVMDQTTVTRNVALLKKLGMVRTVATDDKRTRAVSLTDQGHQTHARAVPLWSRVQADLSASLGPERLGRFLEDLSLIRSLLSGMTLKEEA